MLAALAATVCACHAGVDQDFDAANRLYEGGKYGEARQAYDRLAHDGATSANLYYNRGNAAWKLGDTGHAVADYLRALELEPGHKEARVNLAFVRDQSGSKTATREWWQRALAGMDGNAAAILLSIAAWAALFCIALAVTLPGMRAGALGAMALALCIGAYAGGALWLAGIESTRAIVIAKSVQARVAPAGVAPIADVLPTGSEVLLPEPRGGWTYCTLPDGSRGWVPAEAIERVNPG